MKNIIIYNKIDNSVGGGKINDDAKDLGRKLGLSDKEMEAN